MKKFMLVFSFLIISCAPVFSKEKPEEVSLGRVYDLAIYAYNRGKNEEAKNLLEYLTTQTNQYPVAFFVLGKIYRKAPYNDLEKAKEYFEKTYLFSNKNKTYKKYALVMLSYCWNDNLDIALQKAKEAYELDGNDPDVTFAYASALSKKGTDLLRKQDFQEAIKYLELSVNIRKDIYQSKNSLALCYLKLIDRKLLDKNVYCQKTKKLLDFIGSKVKPYPEFDNNLEKYKNICSK